MFLQFALDLRLPSRGLKLRIRAFLDSQVNLCKALGNLVDAHPHLGHPFLWADPHWKTNETTIWVTNLRSLHWIGLNFYGLYRTRI